MIPVPSGVRVWIATGHTDMRRGMNGLSLLVQEGLKRDPFAGDLYVFRGRRGDFRHRKRRAANWILSRRPCAGKSPRVRP